MVLAANTGPGVTSSVFGLTAEAGMVVLSSPGAKMDSGIAHLHEADTPLWL